jgi:triosephosphate isomerase
MLLLPMLQRVAPAERALGFRRAMAATSAHPMFVGVSLKMYFDHERTLRWCSDVAQIAAAHPAVVGGAVDLVVIPSFPQLQAAVGIFDGTRVQVGAQNLSWEDAGAFTGEVSASQLAQVGCTHVEIGHAERRRIFQENDQMLQGKVAAAVRNSLTPILCVGEPEPDGVDAAARLCVEQLETMSRTVTSSLGGFRAVVAYEPEWAIGAERPASLEHIRGVCSQIKRWLDEHPQLGGSRVIYGGSAGPGLVTSLGESFDGVFLGRFAHRPEAVGGVLDEALALTQEPLAQGPTIQAPTTQDPTIQRQGVKSD